MQYCLVNNGTIIDGPRALPSAWGLIPDMNALSQSELIELGWLPNRIMPVTEPNKIIIGTNFVVAGNEVIESYETRDMTADEITQQNNARWENVRVERDRKLQESDYTQLVDAPFTDAEKLNWASYRQALRDITKQTDPNHVLWPQLPGKAIGVAVL